ncbi:MAG: D-glycero-beta-D-manno-heptose 1-phosphate adenylyltransferase [Desulfobulbus propionicus]|nr:MAG: D-glycero-beta-D-manno-heptose 1-phosphate adenylyltransferase [Desulfobulbus propionicus]
MSPSSFFPALGFAQFFIEPGQIASNIDRLRTLLASTSFPSKTLVVLPELWATGYDLFQTLELAQAAEDVKRELVALAIKFDCFFAGTIAEMAPARGRPYNTLLFIGPDGELGRLPKQHLFSHWDEDRFYAAGRNCCPIQSPFGLIGGMVCYDLRFPEIAREQAFAGACSLIVAAQWPKIRTAHWRILLQARAIENQVFVAGANGCGLSGKVELGGHSMLIAPDGRILAEAGNEPQLGWVEIDVHIQQKLRSMFCPPARRVWRHDDGHKVHSPGSLKQKTDTIKLQGSTLVFTNGCFDILHAGHVAYLEQARKAGDCLVVGLNSDTSVRRLKGPHRPVNNEKDRARVLAALGCVDFIVFFDEDTPLELIISLMPDVLVKGADWNENEIVGAKEVKASGGMVVRIAFEHDCSTTAVIERIQSRS